MMLRSVLLLFLFLCLCACQPQKIPYAHTPTVENEALTSDHEAPLEPPIDPDIVSSLATAAFLPLEDYSDPREYPAITVMIHFSSNVIANRSDPYQLEDIRQIFLRDEVSTHYIVGRDGSIECWVPEQRVAWHAGQGTYGDEEIYTNTLNKYCIGIEVLAIGSQTDMRPYLTAKQYAALDPSLIGYTDEQYESLRVLIRDICLRWQIPCDREHVIGHSEYSPGKTDPGELFDWNRVLG